jgi:hypothetical protein
VEGSCGHGNEPPSSIKCWEVLEYRAIGLVLDFIPRFVCGRQIIPQRFGDWICLRPQVDGAGLNLLSWVR